MTSSEPTLIPAHAHRALLYVERLDLVDVRPNVQQVEAIARNEGPRPARYGNAFTTSLAQTMAAINYKVSDAEPVIDYLVRMGWLLAANGTGDASVELTRLGRALLVSLRLQAPGQVQDYEGSSAIVLSPDNPFVYTDLTRAVAAAGAGLLIDPYFKADMLQWLLSATTISRLLVAKQAGEVPQLELALDALKDLPDVDRLEVRATSSEALHDRCLVHANGLIELLGTSVTGIGKHLSTITPLPAVAAATYQAHLDELWSSAKRVEAKSIRRTLPDVPPDASDEPHESQSD